MTDLIKWPELKEIIGVSRATLYIWEKEGKFPSRIFLGPNTVRWSKDKVDEWLKEKYQ